MDTANVTRSMRTRLFLRGLSIQQRLPLLICILLLVVIIIGGTISYLEVRNAALKTGSSRLLSSGDQLSTLLGQSMQSVITSTRALGEQEVVKQFLRVKDSTSKNATLNLLQQVQDTSTVSMEILDDQLRVMLKTGKAGADSTVNYQMLAKNKARPDTGKIGELYVINDSLYYPVVAGIKDKKGLSGYLVRWRRISNNARTMERVTKLMGMDDAEIYFGNANNSLWISLSSPTTQPEILPIPAGPRQAKDVQSYTTREGKEVIGVVIPIRQTRWQLLIEEPRQTILQPARDFLKKIIIGGLFLLLIGIFWAWIMSRNITRPLKKLTAAATAIAAGNLSAKVEVSRNDEVGELARAFNAMILQLNKARERLENKVVEAKEVNDQLRDLSAHLQNIREDERIHIAREMHDELGQLLTGFKMDVSWLTKRLTDRDDPAIKEKLQGMIALVDDSVKFVRKIAAELRPSILDDLGLVAALEWHSKEFEKRYNIQVNFHSPPQDLKTSALIGTGLFRMYQESLTNVARHSGADKVEASLKKNGNKIMLSISDNGKGFDTRQVQKKTLGLLGMKERAIMVGGNLQIRSQLGKGTSIEIIVPVPENATDKVPQNT
ncbi:MAG: sensor histidine kinase [Chitinophagaceae bacterium]|nr:sensor histidine kinase [Chitinophagaceae bacterium]